MRIRRGRPGFYRGGGQIDASRVPQDYAILRTLAAGFFRNSRPTLDEQWEAQAEVRLIAAQAAALRLPPDSPPELVEACAYAEKGELSAVDDYKRASDTVIAKFS